MKTQAQIKADAIKLKFNTRMVRAIERNDMFSLQNWTMDELLELKLVAEWELAHNAYAEICDEIERRP